MRMKTIKLILWTAIFVAIFGSAKNAMALPAFPGAEGQGASTVGGRGGTVYKVTNLNDSGPGSLRAAVEATGSRIVVFDVSGYINLQSELVVSNPYITIAGQTSPGGITLTGWQTRIYGTHDVIITHMRFRPGSHGQGAVDPDSVHAFITDGGNSPVYNVILDHCSFSYGIDETIDVAYDARDITFSWCIIGPGLSNAGHSEGGHSAGMVFWGKYASPNQIVTAHHSFFPNNHFRDPEIGSGVTADLRNNVAYNWGGSLSPQFNHPDDSGDGPHSFMNFAHNYSKAGPDSNPCGDYSSEMFFCDGLDPTNKCHAQAAGAYPAIYYQGNLGCARTSQADPEWKIITGWSPFDLLSTNWQKATPFPVNDIPVTTTEMSSVYAAEIVTTTGATKPVRDSIDAQLAADFSNGTELQQPLDVVYPDDFPVFENASPSADTDNDGMADNWEISTFSSLNQASSGDFDGDG
ncbi:MAG: Pectate lyase, partial [Patescibacteria group bacterium]|nr:Pectate lyase [Patescibacteria group bacterium]